MPRPMKSFTQDPSVTSHKLTRGTLRRILGYARPYRRLIAGFLALIVFDALLAAAGPLVLKAIIDVCFCVPASRNDVDAFAKTSLSIRISKVSDRRTRLASPA